MIIFLPILTKQKSNSLVKLERVSWLDKDSDFHVSFVALVLYSTFTTSTPKRFVWLED